MPIILFRVDERLIHGQVVVGWGAALSPDRIILVDDQLAGSRWEQELYALGLPPGVDALFVTVADARARLSAWREDQSRSILLTRDIATMRRLAEGGVLDGATVNIGGIHHAPGRERVLPYVFLSVEEKEDLAALARTGLEVSAQDLPSSRRVGLERLLAGVDGE